MDDEYKNFFFNKEYLESIYNVLKGDEKELKREVIKNYIETVEGVEYEGKFEKNLLLDLEHIEEENDVNNKQDYLTFEEFCEMFQKIYENSQNPKNIFLEGFAFLDQEK